MEPLLPDRSLTRFAKVASSKFSGLEAAAGLGVPPGEPRLQGGLLSSRHLLSV